MEKRGVSNRGTTKKKVVRAGTAWADSLVIERETVEVTCPKFQGGVTFTVSEVSELGRLALLRTLPANNASKADWIEWSAEIVMATVIDKETKETIFTKESALYLVMSEDESIESLVLAAIEICGFQNEKKKGAKR